MKAAKGDPGIPDEIPVSYIIQNNFKYHNRSFTNRAAFIFRPDTPNVASYSEAKSLTRNPIL